MRVSVCLRVGFCMCACVSMCECVSALWMKEVNVQVHTSLSFIDSQYVLLPG